MENQKSVLDNISSQLVKERGTTKTTGETPVNGSDWPEALEERRQQALDAVANAMARAHTCGLTGRDVKTDERTYETHVRMTGKTAGDWMSIDYDPASRTLSLSYDEDSDDAFFAATEIMRTHNRLWSALTVNGEEVMR